MGQFFNSLANRRFRHMSGAAMRRFFQTLWRQEDAATAVEYAVMLALIIVAIIGVIGSVGANTGGMWGNIESDLNAAGVGS
jgi:Flp pilus assembly pilin Flp